MGVACREGMVQEVSRMHRAGATRRSERQGLAASVDRLVRLNGASCCYQREREMIGLVSASFTAFMCRHD